MKGYCCCSCCCCCYGCYCYGCYCCCSCCCCCCFFPGNFCSAGVCTKGSHDTTALQAAAADYSTPARSNRRYPRHPPPPRYPGGFRYAMHSTQHSILVWRWVVAGLYRRRVRPMPCLVWAKWKWGWWGWPGRREGVRVHG